MAHRMSCLWFPPVMKIVKSHWAVCMIHYGLLVNYWCCWMDCFVEISTTQHSPLKTTIAWWTSNSFDNTFLVSLALLVFNIIPYVYGCGAAHVNDPFLGWLVLTYPRLSQPKPKSFHWLQWLPRDVKCLMSWGLGILASCTATFRSRTLDGCGGVWSQIIVDPPLRVL